jgi:hypothetical protein
LIKIGSRFQTDLAPLRRLVARSRATANLAVTQFEPFRRNDLVRFSTGRLSPKTGTKRAALGISGCGKFSFSDQSLGLEEIENDELPSGSTSASSGA